jgi:hypothetical protein
MSDWIDAAWGLFKVVAPWLTGGLAGATLTYFLNQRIARRKQARLLLTSQRVDYSLAARDEHLKDLHVSYEGQEFDNLLLYQLIVENVSGKTVQKSPILFRCSAETEVVYQDSVTFPLKSPTTFVRQTGHECAFLWEAGELKPGDSARLKLLLASTTSIDFDWRGDDEVDVESYGREAAGALELQLRNAIVWIALFILSGSIPFVGGAGQAAFLIFSLPSIVPYIMRWLPVIANANRRESQQFNIVHSSNVAVGVGGANVHLEQVGSKDPDIADGTKRPMG